MLIAHLVPGYFAANYIHNRQSKGWTNLQKIGMWGVALGSTSAPDVDVIYNALFRGFINHSTLWTHSALPYLGLGLIWLGLYWFTPWRYAQILLGLAVIGGLSHLVLDVIAHGTPLLYPLSLTMFGHPPHRVVEGGLLAYLTDPIFLLEPIAVTLMSSHWVMHQRQVNFSVRTGFIVILFSLLVIFSIAFLILLPNIRQFVGQGG